MGLMVYQIISNAQACFINQDISIQAQASQELVLNVSGLINEDLSGDQSICGVRLVFSHGAIENISMQLSSPIGQSIDLLGPGRINASFTPFINWNILFNDCSTANEPDDGIPGQWNNSSPWASLSSYSGTYDPFLGCLEDFDMGSANGPWTLTIDNLGDNQGQIQYFELIFCDGTGLVCEPCLVDPGAYTFGNPGGVVTSCQGESVDEEFLSVNVEPELQLGQQPLYVYSQAGAINFMDDRPNRVEDLMAGTYVICGMVIEESDRDQVQNFSTLEELQNWINSDETCAGITEECVTLRILPLEEEETIDTVFCQGDTVFFRDFFVMNNLDTSIYLAGVSNTFCDSVIHFSAIMHVVEAEILPSSTEVVCGQSVFLNGLQSSSNLGTITDYSWTSPEGSFLSDVGPIAEVNGEGRYQLVTISGSCSDTAEVVLTELSTAEFDYEIEAINCSTDSSVVNFIGPPGSNFSFGQNVFDQLDDNSFYTFEEGVFDYTAQFGDCVEMATLEITREVQALTIQIDADSIDCNNSEALILLETNATNPTFMISGPQTFETDMLSFGLSQEGLYEVTAIDDGGCMISSGFEVVSDMQTPDYSIEDIVIDCTDNIPSFDLIINSEFNSIRWEGPQNFESNQLSFVPEVPGEYFLEIIGTNGCVASDVVEFTVNNTGVQHEVFADSIDCIDVQVEVCINSNSIIDSIQWPAMTSSNNCMIFDLPGMYNYVIYSGLCSSMGTFTVEDLREPLDYQLNLGAASLPCNSEPLAVSVELDMGQNDYFVIWMREGLEISNALETLISDPGEYEVVITDRVSGCSESEIFTIAPSDNTLSDFELQIIQPMCFPDPGLIMMTGLPVNTVFGVFLNDEVIDLRDLPVIELVPGQYELEIEVENGCMYTQAFEILQGSTLELTLGEDIETSPLVPVTLNAETNLSLTELSQIEWLVQDSIVCDNCLTTTYFPLSNQEIILQLTDLSGCQISDTLNIDINEDKMYYIPNIFSPNSISGNEHFEIYLSDAIIEVFDFRIFDRWGNLVLFRPEISGDTANFVWDGFFSGKKAESGVYAYMAKLLLVDGTERQIFGQVILLR